MPSNPEKGSAFRQDAQAVLERELGLRLGAEVPLPIGEPPKDHRFDLVSEDRQWVFECKNLAWRENGGVPQAKITSMTEAAAVLQRVKHHCTRALVLNRAIHPRRIETLAEYYARLHRHQLGSVGLAEVDSSGKLRWLISPKAD